MEELLPHAPFLFLNSVGTGRFDLNKDGELSFASNHVLTSAVCLPSVMMGPLCLPVAPPDSLTLPVWSGRVVPEADGPAPCSLIGGP